jgi:beta-glucosidase
LGLNHYSSRYVEDTTTPVNPVGWLKDSSVRVETTSNNGTLIGKQMFPDWLISVPWGFKKLLLYLHNKYDAPIYVTENGVAEYNDPNLPKEEAIKDEHRIEYYSQYLNAMAEAIKEGANIKGYMAWSFLDNFEWVSGYSVRFGLFWIDFKGNLERVPKQSVTWWTNLLSQYQPTFLEKYGIVIISAIIGIAAIGISILMAIYFGLKYIVDKKRQYQEFS